MPTNVVTLCAPREKVNREPLTETALFEAKLSLDDVTHGVMLHGAAPWMKTETFVALVLLLAATIATVPSVVRLKAESQTLEGTVPLVLTLW